eukprot:Gb_32223 [translate_table: standard]
MVDWSVVDILEETDNHPMKWDAMEVAETWPLGAHRSKGTREHSLETIVPMSLEEKCKIVEDEITITREQINKLHIESEHTLGDLRVMVEEAELSIIEIKREQATFKRGHVQS